MTAEETTKPTRSKTQRHIHNLIWKAYIQRQRRWRLLVLETLFAVLLFVCGVIVVKPVFLTPLEAHPEAPLTSSSIIASMRKDNILGYAPDIPPYTSIMTTATQRLGVGMLSAESEDVLNAMLYNQTKGSIIRKPVIWIVWKPYMGNKWEFSIRSTERARYVTNRDTDYTNPHLKSGFLAVQLAVSEAILSYVSPTTPHYQMWLVSMPVSPLMQQHRVLRAISVILFCCVLSLLPPVLETEVLVVKETMNGFKRSLRIRDVDYSSMYIGWLTFAFLSTLPVCMVINISLIQIFRWVHLLYTLAVTVAYISVMIMLAFLMALFHRKAWIACVWTTLFTSMQMFLAELISHHQLDDKHEALTLFLHLIIPPLGLKYGLHEFALLQIAGSGKTKNFSLIYTIVLWALVVVIYFGLLMLLQRTLKDIAIGGPVPWRSIIFKKMMDINVVHHIETPTGNERERLQEVDEFLAKAISMRNVSKSIMSARIVSNLTLDVYRGELTMLHCERVQAQMLNTVEDLLAGLTYPDNGSINVLGMELRPGINMMSMPYMMGYCHNTKFLVNELTVQEHLTLFCSICLWNESQAYVTEYCHIRSKRLLHDCDLAAVRHEYVYNLHVYYRAQLSWALALLLEPRVVMVPSLYGHPIYKAVMKDKMVQYRGYLSIIKLALSSLSLENADRVFLFDTRLLVFGGTPAYMFFKYGREYRVRISLRSDRQNDDLVKGMLRKAKQANATVRAFLGSLLILRLPTSPTANAAAFIKYLNDESSEYGIVSMHISVPDSEEVCNRAIHEMRAGMHSGDVVHNLTKTALTNIAGPALWKRSHAWWSGYTNLKYFAWKFFTFHIKHRLYFIITVIAALVAGFFIGLSFTNVLSDIETNHATKKILHGDLLTVEALRQKTTLVLRLDNSSEATSIATAYVLSETDAKKAQVKNMYYTALSYRESLTEYLVTRAVDSPQKYVYMYAYGIDLAKDNDTIRIRALYSPLHKDYGSAARSLARAYMALIRHYTNKMDATIRVIDDSLALDLSLWLEEASTPPLLVQFLLILSISHFAYIPSKESGFIRHSQCYARNSAPLCYWTALFICDFFLYCLLVFLISGAMVVTMLFVTPISFHYTDLVVIPILLTVYGAGSIPQAYVFSLGKLTALNIMIFMIVNIVFGETTVIAKLLYGDALHYALHFLTLSPQFNMGYGFVKVKRIFLYNSECIVFERKKLCSSKTLHKCCPKCGVLQDCFSKKYYLSKEGGVVMELLAMLSAALVFMLILCLWEYKLIQCLWRNLASKWVLKNVTAHEPENPGAIQEKYDVIKKSKELNDDKKIKVDTFGEYLLAYNVTKVRTEAYSIRNIFFGLGKGEALAISGLKAHGRLKLCQMLAGYKLPTSGQLWCKSTWRLDKHYYLYARQISLSCQQDGPLPPWMTVYNGLELVAVLRGVPPAHVHQEVLNYIDALELRYYVNILVKDVPQKYHTRLNFAAAVVGAPAIIVLDECTAHQKYSVRRAMYHILFHLRKRGHALITSSSNVESHLPVTHRLAILLEGRIYDIDQVDNLIERYSAKGYTVVVHLKDEVDVQQMFAKVFRNFYINDTTEVLVNIQVLDPDLNWATIFEKMENLQASDTRVYSYIISAIPIDNIYNTILAQETRRYIVKERLSFLAKFMLPKVKKVYPSDSALTQLKPFEKQYSVNKLLPLPWSVIFQR